MGAIFKLLFLGGAVLAIVYLAGGFDTPRPTATVQATRPAVAQAAATVDKSAGMQADRKALIDRLIAAGVFEKITVPGSLPRLWVTGPFYSLPFQDKEQFVAVVYAYYFTGSSVADSVELYDGLSGKKVGSYSLANPGLRMK